MKISCFARACAAALAFVALSAHAATTTPVPLSTTSYTDLGAGPMLLGAGAGNVIYQVSDSQPAVGSGGQIQRVTDPPTPLSGTAHVWAIGGGTVGTPASAIVTSGSGVVGGSSIGTVTQGPAASASGAWPVYETIGGVAMSATNGLFVNPATGATFPVSGSVSISGSVAVTGTFWQATQPVSGSVTATLGAGAANIGTIGNTSFGISGTLPAFAATPTVNSAQNGVWQVTPTLTTVSTMTLTATTTAYTAGQIVSNNATAASITNPSFAMPTLGGAIPRLRVQTTDTTSTAWAGASIQIDLWSSAPTWTNGDHATWLPLTGSGAHIASFACTFPTAVWGDGLAVECLPVQGNYASVTNTTVYWSVQAMSGSGVLGASKAIKLIAELN